MRRILALSVVPIVTGALAAPASAAPTVTYHGVWTGVTYNCTPARADSNLAGVWNVTLRDGQDAQVTVTMFNENQGEAPAGVPDSVEPRKGDLHALWTLPFTVLPSSDLFDISTSLGPVVLSMTLTTSGALTYTLTGYPGCALITMTGQLTTP
jgi:hypothetical protein